MQGFLGERECFYSVIQCSLVYLSKGSELFVHYKSINKQWHKEQRGAVRLKDAIKAITRVNGRAKKKKKKVEGNGAASLKLSRSMFKEHMVQLVSLLCF